jgi:hypothetical protein
MRFDQIQPPRATPEGRFYLGPSTWSSTWFFYLVQSNYLSFYLVQSNYLPSNLKLSNRTNSGFFLRTSSAQGIVVSPTGTSLPT